VCGVDVTLSEQRCMCLLTGNPVKVSNCCGSGRILQVFKLHNQSLQRPLYRESEREYRVLPTEM